MKSEEREDANLVKILRGLRGALARGAIDRIELRHLLETSGEAVALTLSGESLQSDIRAAGNNEAAASALAEQILSHAEEEAKTLRGVNRYGVTVYRPGDSQYCNRTLFTLRGTAIEDSDSIEESEKPNATGLVSQMMRHTEVMARMSEVGHERQVRYYDGMLSQLGRLVENMMEKHVRVLEVTETLLDAKAEREINIKRMETGDAFKKRLLEQFMMTAAPLVHKLTSGNPDVNAAATDNLMVTFAASLKPEQMAQLAQVLAPEQQAIFLELYTALRARHETVALESGDAKKKGGGSEGGAPAAP